MSLLSRMRSYRDENESGFSMIELLVVILIIGILSAIAIPLFMNQRAAAADAALASDLRSTAQAIETWQTRHGKIASDMEVGDSSWTIVIRHSPSTPSMAHVATGSEFHPEGFVPPKMSKGNAVGVLTGLTQGGEGGGYCISGNNEGGSYKARLSSDKRDYALYYDSLAGGIFKPEDLPTEGACKYHTDFMTVNK